MKIKRPESLQPLPKHAKEVFVGKSFTIYHWDQLQFDGTTEVFEKLIRQDTVSIIPITKDGKIILTKQEQPGSKPFFGLVGGIVDRGEDILTCAKRELLEETGYAASDFSLFFSTQPFSRVDWTIYTFIAKNCEKIAEQNLDSGEKIKLQFVNFDQMLKIILREDFRDREFALNLLRIKENKKEFERLKKLFF